MSTPSVPATGALYGLVAEFATPEKLLEATRQARSAGYRHMEAYTPFPVHGLAEALDFHQTHIPLVVLLGGIAGGLGGYVLQYWVNVIDYPLNVGGRPLHSWPAFIPVTFELTILIAALAAVLGMLALNGLPMPYHPLFNVPSFATVTRDGFFLCIEARDPKFDRSETRRFLESIAARDITEVEP
jgi:ActD protein